MAPVKTVGKRGGGCKILIFVYNIRLKFSLFEVKKTGNKNKLKRFL